MDPGLIHLEISTVVLMAAIISLSAVLLTVAWFLRCRKSGLSFTFFILIIPLWISAYVTGLLTADITLYLPISVIEYLMIIALPFFWLLYSRDFSGVKKWHTTGKLLILMVLPLFLLVMAVSGEAPALLYDHHRFFGLEPPIKNNFPLFVQSLFESNQILVWPDVLNLVHVAYLLIYFFLGSILIFKTLISRVDMKGETVLLIGLGIIALWIGSISFIFRTPVIINLDLAPLAFSATAAFLAMGSCSLRRDHMEGFSWKGITDHLSDGFILYDNQNKITYYNAEASKIFRFSEKLTLLQPIETLLSNHPDWVRILKFRTGRQIELPLINGSLKTYYHVDIDPLVNSAGDCIGKVALFRNISPLKDLEARLQESTGKASKADKLTRSFLANMSHEIRTPMNSIIGFSDLLGDPGLEAGQRAEFARLIQESSNSLLNVIESIIDISKLEAGLVSVHEEEVSIPGIMTEIESEYQKKLGSSEKQCLRLSIGDISEDLDQKVSADPVMIRKILCYLLDNAIKFTSEGTVEFGVETMPGKFLQFHVKDTGVGIHKDQHRIIFQRFGRVSAGTMQEYGGLGIGLSICKELTQLLGGRIWFESEPGSGSVFFFTVPFTFVQTGHPINSQKKADTFDASRVYNSHKPKQGNKALVLVPDERAFSFLKLILARLRIEAVWIRTSLEAQKAAENGSSCQLVILAADLPGVPFADSVGLIKRNYPGIPMFALVPFNGSKLADEAVRLGCRGVISRPVNPSYLLDIIREELD